MHPFNLLDTGYLLLFQKSRQFAERKGMPFNGFGTVVLTLMVKNVLINAGAYRTLCTVSIVLPIAGRGRRRLTWFLTRRHRNTSNSIEAFTTKQEAGTLYVAFQFSLPDEAGTYGFPRQELTKRIL